MPELDSQLDNAPDDDGGQAQGADAVHDLQPTPELAQISSSLSHSISSYDSVKAKFNDRSGQKRRHQSWLRWLEAAVELPAVA